ncbi:unnamed protein product, partial [Ectocarpus sp. 4 AP-2014]
ASAAFDLQVTEIWPGNEPGENLTSDWFEVTNLGDMAWTDADGSLYFDDDSADPEAADLISGVTSIAPGESVVFIDADDTVEFESVWGSTIDGVQLGVYAGSGMSQGGDGATLFVSNGQPLLDFSNVVSVDLQEYPDANATGGQSWDVQLGAFSVVGDAAGAFSSVLANDEGQYGIGSLGASVPEPTA